MRVGVLCDFTEESWFSMDLVADMILKHLNREHAGKVRAERLCPRLVRYVSRMPAWSDHRFAFNADRLLNRFWQYPRWLQSHVADFDIFHLVDHSYGQLLHILPPGRTVVTCHDLEAFRCLLEPQHSQRRSLVHRAMAHRSLSGFRQASRVTCDSTATRDELMSHGLFPEDRVFVIPNGVDPACSPEPEPSADREAERLLGPVTNDPLLLNVGTTVPRKRVEFLLQVFAKLRSQFADARLIRVGGEFTAQQTEQIDGLRLAARTTVLPFLSRAVLAAVYRRSTIVVQPSAYEGFGLPVVEAMACGTMVVGSDIPVFREVGGDAIVCCPKDDLDNWSSTIGSLLRERAQDAHAWQQRRAACLKNAARFTWGGYVTQLVALYQKMLSSNGGIRA